MMNGFKTAPIGLLLCGFIPPLFLCLSQALQELLAGSVVHRNPSTVTRVLLLCCAPRSAVVHDHHNRAGLLLVRRLAGWTRHDLKHCTSRLLEPINQQRNLKMSRQPKSPAPLGPVTWFDACARLVLSATQLLRWFPVTIITISGNSHPQQANSCPSPLGRPLHIGTTATCRSTRVWCVPLPAC